MAFQYAPDLSFSRQWSARFMSDVDQKRIDAFQRRQGLLLGYSAGISLFSPPANLYMVKTLHGYTQPINWFRMCARIYPAQVGLRMLQVNLASPIKDNLNPWAAFAALGVLQGVVYGHANVTFATALNLVGKHKKTMRGILRGSGFAAGRDVISQGIPFMLSKRFAEHAVDPILGPIDEKNWFMQGVRHYTSVLSLSLVSCVLSHGLHNGQQVMQTHQELSYTQALSSLYKDHGMKFLYRGAQARIGLMMVTNVFNEIFLKPAWQDRD